jgi:hypothetical protein
VFLDRPGKELRAYGSDRGARGSARFPRPFEAGPGEIDRSRIAPALHQARAYLASNPVTPGKINRDPEIAK